MENSKGNRNMTDIEKREKLYALAQGMIAFYRGEPEQIQHFLKVRSFARLIGEGEGIPEDMMFLLEAVALLHDIGIKPAMEKYGRCDGHLQEEEGPEPARRMLEQLGFAEEITERVCFLIAHHHTITLDEGLDYRILLEADALVNIYENGLSKEAACNMLEMVFRTDTGRQICKTMFALG